VRLHPGVALESVPAQHPAQLYEAICYLITFAILCVLYDKYDLGRRKPGIMFGIGVLGVFLTRPFVEMVKINQEAFEADMALNMGQLLSIPFIILALTMIWLGLKGKLKVGVPDSPLNMEQKSKNKNKKNR
jgi:prolipoprotein diacylglyceryltransferase